MYVGRQGAGTVQQDVSANKHFNLTISIPNVHSNFPTPTDAAYHCETIRLSMWRASSIDHF